METRWRRRRDDLCLFALCLLFAVFLRGGDALSCEPFLGVPEVCSQYIDYKVFMSGQNQTAVGAVLAPNAALLPLLPDINCRINLQKLVCTTNFPRCGQNTSDLTDGFAIRPCKNICQQTVSACKALFESLGRASDLPNCTALDVTGLHPQEPLYPAALTGGSPNATTGITESAEITGGLCVAQVGQVNKASCKGPFTADRNGLCALKCPVPVWDRDDFYHVWNVLNKVFTPIAVLCLVACLVLMLMGGGLRFSNDLSLNFVFSILMNEVHVLFTTYKDSACIDKTTIAYQSNSHYCAFAGWFFQYFTLSTAAWFFSISVNMLLTVLQWRYWVRYPQKFRVGYYVMSWGLPWLPCIIALSKKTIAGGSISCIIDASRNNGAYLDGLQFGWMGFWIVGAILALIAVVFRLCVFMGIESGARQMRLLIFCAIFGYIGLFTLAFRIYSRAKRIDVTNSLSRYAQCSSTGETNCDPGVRYSSAVQFVNAVNQFVLGPSALILFGLTSANFSRTATTFKTMSREKSLRSVMLSNSSGESSSSSRDSTKP